VQAAAFNETPGFDPTAWAPEPASTLLGPDTPDHAPEMLVFEALGLALHGSPPYLAGMMKNQKTKNHRKQLRKPLNRKRAIPDTGISSTAC